MNNARVQWIPNFISCERRLCLTRICWNTGKVGNGVGYSSKLSVSVIFEPRDIWVGVWWDRKGDTRSVYVCLIPCLPIRFKLIRSYGGRFV
jgi:hypothetical protein